jgi:hypothetical protein
LRPGYYDLVAEAAGMRRETIRNVKIDPARETLLNPLRMTGGEFSAAAAPVNPQQAGGPTTSTFAVTGVGDSLSLGLGAYAELLQIADEQKGPNASNAEVATTLTPEQVRGLPVLERDPVALLRLQPGVQQLGVVGRDVPAQLVTVVNGQRASYANMTLDGVNIQESFTRVNALGSDFNRLFLDQLAEFTMVSSNGDATLPGGATQVVMVTPSGTNSRHGALYYYHRNRALAAGNWLDNARAFTPENFRSNQFGATLSGPLVKDRLLLYGNYEGHRLYSSERVVRTLPTDTIRRGVFSYVGTDDFVRQVNLIGLGLQIHPEIRRLLDELPPANLINTPLRGDSFGGLLLNTSGYAFALRDNLARDSGLIRADYIASERHSLAFTFNQTRDDRDDSSRNRTGYATAPTTRVESPRKVLSGAWRWSPAPQWSNEFRAGMHRHVSGLFNTVSPGSRILVPPADPGLPTAPLFDLPVNPASNEQRRGTTLILQSNASWNRGPHNIRFGFQWQQTRSRFSDTAGTIPEFTLGSPAIPFAPGSLPAAGPDVIEAANLWTSVLAGVTTSQSVLFPLTEDGTYAQGQPLVRDLRFPGYSAYVHDTWRIHPRLSLNLGMRYDLFLPVDESRGVSTAPELINNNAVNTLLGDPLIGRAGKAAGRPWFPADRNNFNPNLGLAWDLFGNRSTVFRAGYSVYSVNDEYIGSTFSTLVYNAGNWLSSFITYPATLDQFTVLSDSLQPPRLTQTLPVRFSQGNSATIGLVDPALRTPYVQEWSAGIQKDFWGTVLEVRYVGNSAVKLHRAIDLNQVNTRHPEFFNDFLRAYNNGRLAAAASGIFDPSYNSAIPGSQPLGIMDRFRLDRNEIRQAIRRGEAAEFAAIAGSVNLLPVLPSALAPEGAVLLTNRGTSSFHGLQIEVLRRLDRGLLVQANYAFSKSLSDSQGLSSQRYEPYLDNNNSRLERARTPFDLRHAFKAHVLWEPPLMSLFRGKARRLTQGWALGAVLITQSGNPFSILSTRGTFNISGSLTGFDSRSLNNPASSPLTYPQLKEAVGFHYQPVGFSVIRDNVLNAAGRGAGEAADPAFPGQVFFNPQPGAIGNLQPRMFTGPRQFSIDLALSKSTRLFSTHVIELRAEARNLTNTPSFSIQDQFINSVAFGANGAVLSGSTRQVQLGLYYRF